MNTLNTTQIDSEIKVQPVKEMLETSGMYGEYGGAYVPDVLASQMSKPSDFFDSEVQEAECQERYIHYLKTFVGRPSPLFKAENLSKASGATIYLKREDLNHAG